MSTLTLDREQRERAHELLEAIKRGAINRPTDFLDEWRACPSHDELTERYGRGLFDGPTERTERWVSLADVAGTHATLVDTFKRQRLTAVLRILLEGWFQPKYDHPPHYLEIDGELFVGYDGNHRTMVCKAIRVKEIYAKVSIIKTGESATSAPGSKRDQQRSVSPRISQWIARFACQRS